MTGEGGDTIQQHGVYAKVVVCNENTLLKISDLNLIAIMGVLDGRGVV